MAASNRPYQPTAQPLSSPSVQSHHSSPLPLPHPLAPYIIIARRETQTRTESWLTTGTRVCVCVCCSHHTPLRLQAGPRIQQPRLQHAAWLGNTTALVMVTENDIYVRGSPDSMEHTRLTETGVPGIIYNGVPDWLYQEEVLPRPECTWSSPDGSHLLYATFNDTKVRR